MKRVFISITGVGDDIWSKGMHTNGKRTAEANDWVFKGYRHYSERHILNYLNKHKPEMVAIAGHSMGVDAADNVAEKYKGFINSVFSVASAYPETFPSNVGDVFWITANRDWRQFKIRGGKVVHRHKIKASHTSVDDKQALWDLVDAELKRLNGTGKGVVVSDKPFYIGEYDPLDDSDFIKIAREYGLSEAHVRAVVEVESNGKGSHTSGALVCLYEPHVAFRNTSGVVQSALVNAGLAYRRWKPGSYPKTSYPRIDKCVQTVAANHAGGYEAGVTIASLATSWGLGQILGENYKLAGFQSASDMVREFAKGEFYQLRGMLEFIKNKGILDDLKAGRWVTFAEGYNGKQQARHNYSGRLEKAYRRWVERINDRGDIVVIQEPEIEPEITDLGELTIEDVRELSTPQIKDSLIKALEFEKLLVEELAKRATQDSEPTRTIEVTPIMGDTMNFQPIEPEGNETMKLLNMLPFNGGKTITGVIGVVGSLLAIRNGMEIPPWFVEMFGGVGAVGVAHKIDKGISEIKRLADALQGQS